MAPGSPGLADRPPAWTRNYVGLPWQAGGRGRDGLDCYGLVRLVLADQHELVLPALSGAAWPAPGGKGKGAELVALAAFMAANRQGWREVEFADRRPFDVLLLLVAGRALHCGLVVAPNWFLHVQQGHDAALARLDGLPWRDRLGGVFRHQALTGAEAAA